MTAFIVHVVPHDDAVPFRVERTARLYAAEVNKLADAHPGEGLGRATVWTVEAWNRRSEEVDR